MKNLTSTLSGLTFGAAAVMVLAATMHLPSTLVANAAQTAVVAPTHPYNINPDPNGRYFVNTYDPYAEGEPDDATPSVIGLSPQLPDNQPIHPPRHH